MTTEPIHVLVAGGTGFLGAAFVRELDDRGHRVSVLSRQAEKVAHRFPGRPISARTGDVTRPGSLRKALEGVDCVIHCVQFQGYPVEDGSRGRTFQEVDARGTARMVRAAEEAGVRRFVYLSGVGADPDSGRAWYRAKGQAEVAVAAASPVHVIVRPSWVYGPEDDALNRFVTVLRRVPFFFPQLGSGSQRINPIFVQDLARVVVTLATTMGRADAETLEIGGPITYTMDHIIRLVMDATGRRKPIVHLPLRIVQAGAAVLEFLPGQILSRDAIRFATQSGLADNARFRTLFPEERLTPMPEALATYLGAEQ